MPGAGSMGWAIGSDVTTWMTVSPACPEAQVLTAGCSVTDPEASMKSAPDPRSGPIIEFGTVVVERKRNCRTGSRNPGCAWNAWPLLMLLTFVEDVLKPCSGFRFTPVGAGVAAPVVTPFGTRSFVLNPVIIDRFPP